MHDVRCQPVGARLARVGSGRYVDLKGARKGRGGGGIVRSY